MTNTQKVYIAIAGIVLILAAFLMGKSFSKNVVQIVPVQNNTSTTTSTPSTSKTPNKTLTEIIETYNGYSVGEERTLEQLTQEDVDQNVGIGLIDEVEYAFDTKNSVSYKFYRAGHGDVPPHYSTGRIIVWIQTAGKPPIRGGLFDTQITDVEPFGKIESNSTGGITINCSPKSAIGINDCKYSVLFNPDQLTLAVKKLK
ncbi:MAG TPA: hypothetical protein PK295_03810 [Candidatus Magasanikbacteria bacterium]|nr:hypothetical protein [Candidatus Magasanikbacteria bacterium]